MTKVALQAGLCYNAGTWKPIARAVGVLGSGFIQTKKTLVELRALALQECKVKLLDVEASTEVWLSRFTTF